LDLGDFLIGSLTVILYIGIIFTWIFSLFDLLARSDLSGWMKGFWLVAIIFVPIIGVVAYFIFRPKEAVWFGRNQGYDPNYARDQQIGEMTTLIRWRNEGTITQEEFERMRDRVMAA
jgi:hypothetical protein